MLFVMSVAVQWWEKLRPIMQRFCKCYLLIIIILYSRSTVIIFRRLERRSLIKHTYTQHTSYVLCTRSDQHFYIPAHTTCPLEEGECYFLLLPLGERWCWEELQHNSSLLAAAFVVGMQKVAKLPFGEAECKKIIILLSFTNKTVSITI